MFDKFGEFNSVEELNRAAAAQKAEGDEEALVALAVENGIDREDAEDFMDDCTPELATPLMAALGKLKVECRELKIDKVLLDWVMELQAACTESEDLCRAVRSKDKSLAGYIARLADSGYENKIVVSKKIVDKCRSDIKRIAGSHDFYIGIPDKSKRSGLMKEYYLGK